MKLIVSGKAKNNWYFVRLLEFLHYLCTHEIDDKATYFCCDAVGGVPANAAVVVFTCASRGAFRRGRM